MNLSKLVPGVFVKASSTKGGEFHGPCPVCGGKDRFHIWPEQGDHGTYWCRGCEIGGDAIQYLRDVDGLSYREACIQLGKEPAATIRKPLTASSMNSKNIFIPSTSIKQSELWQEKLGAFVSLCHNELLGNQEQLDWLLSRGIDLDQVVKYRLGWNKSDLFRPRASWGLPNEFKEGGKLKKLWIPPGLIIPWFVDGNIHRVRVRRPDGQQTRYYVVPGSGKSPLITSMKASAYMIVESELCGIMLDDVAGDLVGVVAMGNSTAKPDDIVFKRLRSSLHLSIGLDSDTPTKNKRTEKMESAGAKASCWWLDNFHQADRTPVIGGKDPGEAFEAGIDIRTWVMAGLPPKYHLDRIMPVPEPEPEVVTYNTKKDDEDSIIFGETDKGREYVVTSSRERYQREVSDGLRPVFSAGEVQRLHPIVAGTDLVDIIMDIKEIFPGAYITSSRK